MTLCDTKNILHEIFNILDEPFCLYDANLNQDTKNFKGPGVLICSIDNMPTQLPREATDFFGDLLLPHVMDILKSDATQVLFLTAISAYCCGS